MRSLTEEELSYVLHRLVPANCPGPDRAALVRHRAGQIQRRRLAIGFTLLVALAVTVPTLLAPSGNNSPTVADGGPSKIVGPSTTSGRNCATAVCDPKTILANLRRPLQLPASKAGQTCPVSALRRFTGGGGFSGPFSAVGPGPGYFTGDGTVTFAPGPPNDSGYAASGWAAEKVVWVIDAKYGGPLLIRGAQIDGHHRLQFDRYIGAVGYSSGAGSGPYPELAYLQQDDSAQTGAGIHTYPSVIRGKAPGCYALQIDGVNFSEILVFKAKSPIK